MKIGTDIVEHSRFIKNKETLARRILSEQEFLYYDQMKSEKRQIEYIASRFASKEAIFKCYQNGDKTFNYKDISILNNSDGSPYVFCERIAEEILISISHCDSYSLAMVLIPSLS